MTTKADFDRALEKARQRPEELETRDLAVLAEYGGPALVECFVTKSVTKTALPPRPPAPEPLPRKAIDSIATAVSAVVGPALVQLQREVAEERAELAELRASVAALEAAVADLRRSTADPDHETMATPVHDAFVGTSGKPS
jgi:hypothetical protein